MLSDRFMDEEELQATRVKLKLGKEVNIDPERLGIALAQLPRLEKAEGAIRKLVWLMVGAAVLLLLLVVMNACDSTRDFGPMADAPHGEVVAACNGAGAAVHAPDDAELAALISMASESLELSCEEDADADLLCVPEGAICGYLMASEAEQAAMDLAALLEGMGIEVADPDADAGSGDYQVAAKCACIDYYEEP